jgi:hypothetical protein
MIAGYGRLEHSEPLNQLSLRTEFGLSTRSLAKRTLHPPDSTFTSNIGGLGYNYRERSLYT